MARFINPADFLTPNGKLFFTKSGTAIDLDTFSDSLLTPALKNTNPVIIPANGVVPNIFFEGTAKVVLKDVNDVQIYERDPVGGESVTGDFALFNLLIVYDINDIVEGTDGKFYISLAENNQGNDPVTPSPSKWSEIRFVGVYNASQSYDIGDVVQELDGLMWRSLITPNLGNTPSTDDGTKWLPVVLDPWINKSAGFTIEPNKKYQIDGSAGTVDGALKTAYVVGDEIIVHNESISTNLVKLTNSTLTIKGPGGTVTSSDNLELEPGDTAHLVAKTTTILEVV